MKKLLMSIIILGASTLSFACKVDLSKTTILCKGKYLSNTSTFEEFSKCNSVTVVSKKIHGIDGFKVSFADDNGKDYNCFFVSNDSKSVVKGCRD